MDNGIGQWSEYLLKVLFIKKDFSSKLFLEAFSFIE